MVPNVKTNVSTNSFTSRKHTAQFLAHVMSSFSLCMLLFTNNKTEVVKKTTVLMINVLLSKTAQGT